MVGLTLVVVVAIVGCGLTGVDKPGLRVTIVTLVSLGFPPLVRHSSVVWEVELG